MSNTAQKVKLDMTDQQKAELAALAAMSDDEIDTSDIPEIPTDWANAKRGVFHNGQVVKQQVTLWFEDLDDDVVAWLKANASDTRGYKELINRALREHVRREKARNSAES